MPRRDFTIRPNGARPVALERKKPEEVLGTVESPAARIRAAEEILRELLLENEFEEDQILLGPVADGLDQIHLRLSDLAGRQELFELWMGR